MINYEESVDNPLISKKDNNDELMKKIIPIIALFLLMLASCLHSGNVRGQGDLSADSVSVAADTDSFTVVYRQSVNGYQVKAVVRMGDDVLCADIEFTKDGKSFVLHTTSFGDSEFNKGGWGLDGTNEELMEQYKGKTMEAEYPERKEDGVVMSGNTPFFFRDLDFDGGEELVIVHYAMAVRCHSKFDVYRLVEGEPVLIDYPPYRTEEAFGMTNYPEFDYKKKLIRCPYPEGELKYKGCKVYGVSKTDKDTVVVNGHEFYFNHLELIEDVKYSE